MTLALPRLMLFLSSGHSEQYKRDIIRALAMPAGAEIQFRYQAKYVQDELLGALSSLRGERPRALIAYIDQSDPDSGTEPELVPVRYATLVNVETYGRFHIFRLELAGLSATTNVREFNYAVRSLAAGVVPVWHARKPEGKYCLWLEAPPGTEETSDLVAFEDTVKLLGSHAKDFGEETLYYHLLGFESVPEGVIASPRRGEVTLGANATYELRVMHFNPNAASETRLLFQSGSPSVLITSNPVLHFNSRYDLKRVRLRVANPPSAQGELPTIDEDTASAHTASILSVYRLSKGSKVEDRELEFDLPVRVRPDLPPVMAFGALLGWALSVPSLVSIWASSALSETLKWSMSVIAVLASITLGMVAALGLRRPTP